MCGLFGLFRSSLHRKVEEENDLVVGILVSLSQPPSASVDSDQMARVSLLATAILPANTHFPARNGLAQPSQPTSCSHQFASQVMDSSLDALGLVLQSSVSPLTSVTCGGGEEGGSGFRERTLARQN